MPSGAASGRLKNGVIAIRSMVRLEGLTRHGRRVAVVAVLDLAIVLGVGAHLAGGIATGADSDPLGVLGTTFVEGSCPSVSLSVGTGATVVCPSWTAITSPAGVVRVVSLYGPDNAVVAPFAGALPLGLHWGDELDSVWARLGRPNRVTSIYGTPTLVYMFETERYGSLELRFDAGNHLMRVNASSVR